MLDRKWIRAGQDWKTFNGDGDGDGDGDGNSEAMVWCGVVWCG